MTTNRNMSETFRLPTWFPVCEKPLRTNLFCAIYPILKKSLKSEMDHETKLKTLNVLLKLKHLKTKSRYRKTQQSQWSFIINLSLCRRLVRAVNQSSTAIFCHQFLQESWVQLPSGCIICDAWRPLVIGNDCMEIQIIIRGANRNCRRETVNPRASRLG